jgi:hypothetical protein
MFLIGVMVEVAADEIWNLESRRQGFGSYPNTISEYEKVSWNGCDVYLESLQLRHQIEIARKREDRIKAIEKYIKNESEAKK